MIDIRILIKKHKLTELKLNTKKFNFDLKKIVNFDRRRKKLLFKLDKLRSFQKLENIIFVKFKKKSSLFKKKILKMRNLSENIKEIKSFLKNTDNRWFHLLLSIPNLPDKNIPIGSKNLKNKIISIWGDISSEDNIAHYDIKNFSKSIDLQRGSQVTGSGFPFFIGETARFARSLIQFFLEEAVLEGYCEINVPMLVNKNSLQSTGQLPDKKNQMYKICNQNYYLIPTAETPMTNFYSNTVLRERDLPVSHCSYTPCFRHEAGSWGSEVRGLNRLHQFDKIETVRWVHPDKSLGELDSLKSYVGRILKKLKLPHRILLMCSGNIGFPHSKQYDLEVWAKGQKRWLEVSSCSNFTNFQSRRAKIQYLSESGKINLIHTVNGSALALPRILAALIENNARSHCEIIVPEVIRPWFGKKIWEIK